MTVKSLGVNSDKDGFIVEATDQDLFTGYASDAVLTHLENWNAESAPYVAVEDGCDIIVERWREGRCLQVLHPDFDFVTTALMLMGVDPNLAFASARRPRPSN